jgi:hypothetical protein
MSEGHSESPGVERPASRKPTLKPDLPRPPTLPPQFKEAARAKAEADAATQAGNPGKFGWMWVVLLLVFAAVAAGLAMRN